MPGKNSLGVLQARTIVAKTNINTNRAIFVSNDTDKETLCFYIWWVCMTANCETHYKDDPITSRTIGSVLFYNAALLHTQQFRSFDTLDPEEINILNHTPTRRLGFTPATNNPENLFLDFLISSKFEPYAHWGRV